MMAARIVLAIIATTMAGIAAGLAVTAGIMGLILAVVTLALATSGRPASRSAQAATGCE